MTNDRITLITATLNLIAAGWTEAEVSELVQSIKAEAWDMGWHEHYLELERQFRDPTHPITKHNPHVRRRS